MNSMHWLPFFVFALTQEKVRRRKNVKAPKSLNFV
uniref:Uncharacterized protein n=1 Tax=Rhizophora mucronata TaxID=61149 RepID=A0A2P2P1A5_RHIMU